MTIEVLISTMHQNDRNILDKMNIQSDSIVVNQCSDDSVEHFLHNNYSVTWINSSQRGLSKSRNMALSFATADICLLADEDEVLVNDYPIIINKAFDEYSSADIISFNFIRLNSTIPTRQNKCRKAPNYKYYSSVSLAFKLMKIKKYGLHFNELIGAGSEYCAGEETVFEQECRVKGLKIYENSNVICSVDASNSTWFKGFDDKYFFNLGVILAIRHGVWAKFFALYYVYRFKMHKEINKRELLCAIYAGISKFYTI